MGAPESRNEAILQATLDSTAYTDPPQSRIESLLLQLKAAIETGGGGGDTTVLAAKVAAIEAQLYSTIAGVPTNTDTGSMDLNSVDLNTITTSGFYNAVTCTNAPANYCTLVVIGYNLAGYCAQIAVDVATGKLHTRTQTNGTWGAWETKASTADLAAVATSGAYSDLTGKPTVDSEISSSSTNAVQNSAIAAAIATLTEKDTEQDATLNPIATAFPLMMRRGSATMNSSSGFGFDDIHETIYYRYTASAIGNPISNGYGLIITFFFTSYGVQFLVSQGTASQPTQLLYRFTADTGTTWKNWRTISTDALTTTAAQSEV